MDFVPFNSRLSWHKTPFGAVKNGTEVTLRIVLPAGFYCSWAHINVIRDGEKFIYPMNYEYTADNGESWWGGSFTPGLPGLYFYSFTLMTGFGEVPITRFDSSSGRISGGGEDFQLTVYDKDFTTPDSVKGSVIYQIFPDRFCFSGEKKESRFPGRIIRDDWGGLPMWEPDEDGNITKYDFFCGDLKGIESKLDYLESLGVGCIYLNPIFEAESNHRYDTADYERIDSLLGTQTDFKRLCSSAKRRGIDIILDGVFSHTGSDSRYFNKNGRYGDGGAYRDKNSPYYSWYKFSEWPDEYESWWGVDILPETDENCDSYIEYICSVLKKWQSLGASGWRLDVADELPDKFLDALRLCVKSQDKDALIIGEVWEDASNKISYGSRRRYLTGSQLDSVMNYPFADALIDFAVTGRAEGFNDKISVICENYPKCVVDCLMNHIGTHDTCRVLSRLGTLDGYVSDPINRYKGDMTAEQHERGVRLLKMVSSMQFTLPGVPSIYYGDEAGAGGGVDPYNRGCYPYGRENEELLSHYRMLGKIRREHPVFKDGEFIPVSDMLGCVCYERRGRGERILTAANRNPHPITYILQDDGFVSLTGQTVCGRALLLGAFETAILYLNCDD